MTDLTHPAGHDDQPSRPAQLHPPMGEHGHVIPRQDGRKSRCGGPRQCKVCRAEWREVVYAARRESWWWRCGGAGVCEVCRAALLATGIDLDAYADKDPDAYDKLSPPPARPAPTPHDTHCSSPGTPSPQAAPLGHSRSAHQLIGWCSHCPNRTAADEVVAWRSWANTLLHTIDDGVCSGA